MSLLPLLHSLDVTGQKSTSGLCLKNHGTYCDAPNQPSWGCSPILGAHISSNTICALGNCHTAGWNPSQQSTTFFSLSSDTLNPVFKICVLLAAIPKPLSLVQKLCLQLPTPHPACAYPLNLPVKIAMDTPPFFLGTLLKSWINNCRRHGRIRFLNFPSQPAQTPGMTSQIRSAQLLSPCSVVMAEPWHLDV